MWIRPEPRHTGMARIQRVRQGRKTPLPTTSMTVTSMSNATGTRVGRSLISVGGTRRMLMALAVVLLLGATKSRAHSVAHPQALHGGSAQAAGPFHLELVLTDGQTRLYVYDVRNTPVATGSAQASAMLWLDGRILSLDLVHAESNSLAALGEFQAGDVRRVTLSLKLDGREPVSVWFSFARQEARLQPDGSVTDAAAR